MGCVGVWLVALLALGPTRWVEDDSGDKQRWTAREQLEEIAKKRGAATPAERYQALVREYDEARQAYRQSMRAAKTDEERLRIFRQSHVGPEAYTHLFQLFARLHPNDAAAQVALVWIASHDPAGPEGQEAMRVLARDHINKESLWRACVALQGLPIDQAESFLRAVAEKSPHRKARAHASYALALILKRWSENAEALADPTSARARQMANYFGEAVAERIRKNSRVMTEEAESLFERIREHYADISGAKLELANYDDVVEVRDQLGQAADHALDEMHNLAIGKPAPDIVGDDLEGRPMKLSDFRGRVVVLNFWATWCGPCMALVPHERVLVKQLQGSPFVLLGISGDDDRDTAKTVARREGMSWRSWWDGGKEGPTATRWNVRGWPAIYILDRQGIIRHKWNESPGAEPLEKAVANLLSLP
jgi:peroxiredoxin